MADDPVAEQTECWKQIDGKLHVSESACTILNELKEAGQLCDAIIKVEDGQFAVHRVVMSVCSMYFRALFTNGMEATRQSEVFIPGITADMMKIIIQYAYTREVQVTADNIERLLPAADQFHVLGLLKGCCTFLFNSLQYNNCIGIRNFARNYFCRVLEQQAYRYLLENFSTTAVTSNELLCLELDDILQIISADDLNVKTEEIVFDAILRWINFEPDVRKSAMPALLNCIRLGLLSREYFVGIIKCHPFVCKNEYCRPLVIETLKLMYDLELGAESVDFPHDLARPRIPHEMMFVIGGWSGGSPTNTIETYDARAGRWFLCDTPDAGPRAYHGCVTVDMRIYLIGGFDGMYYFSSVRCFSPISKQWYEVAPMNCRRCYVSVAALDGCIYALGGFDGRVRQNTGERYDPKTNQWSLLPPMHHQRSDASATTLNGKVYIAGGFNGQHCLDSAEYFDPAVNQWTMISNMLNRRSGVGLIAHIDCLYAIGGFNGLARLQNGEKYNPSLNRWTAIGEMATPRSNFAIEIVDDLVFVIGGFNGETTIFNVESYDNVCDEWLDCTDMNIYRSAVSACVVKALPNIREYITRESNNPTELHNRGETAAALLYGPGEQPQEEDDDDEEDYFEGDGDI